VALDDFDTGDAELDLDQDLFDFPKVDLEPEAPVLAEDPQEAELPQEVIEAAAAVQDEIDSLADDGSVFGMDEDALGDDLDLDDLLSDEDLLGGFADLDDDEMDMDFDQLVPKFAPVAVPEQQVPAAYAPDPAPVAEAASPAPAAAAPMPQLVPTAASASFSWRTAWPLIAGILLFNIVVLAIGLTAVSSVSTSVDTFAAKLGEVARELRTTNTPIIQESPVQVPVDVTAEPETITDPADSGTRVKLPPFARGALKAAQTEMDRGDYQLARRRLFRLLAAIDDPLADDAPEAEEQANLLIAETFVLEANEPNRSQH